MGSGVSTGRSQNTCTMPCVTGYPTPCPSPEFVNTTKRMSLYPYRSPEETNRVSSSEFPFQKPKVVTVRPRPADTGNFQSVNVMRNNDINNVHSNQFLMYNERFPVFEPEPRGNKPHACVNDRRWSASVEANVRIPLQQGNVLIHKTVAQLRESNQGFNYGRSYSYTREVGPGYHQNGNRPATPAPQWLPPRQASDYLLASSLISREQQQNRRSNFR